MDKYKYIYIYIFYVYICIFSFIEYLSLGGCSLLLFQTVFVVPVVLGVVVVVMGKLATAPRPFFPPCGPSVRFSSHASTLVFL